MSLAMFLSSELSPPVKNTHSTFNLNLSSVSLQQSVFTMSFFAALKKSLLDGFPLHEDTVH